MITLFGLKQVRGEVHRGKDVSVSRCCEKTSGLFSSEIPSRVYILRGFVGNSQFLKPTLLSLMEINSRMVLTE